MHATGKGELSVDFSFHGSISSKFQLLLLSMKTNDENNYILFCKGVFFDAKEGLGSKNFLGASLQPSIFSSTNY